MDQASKFYSEAIRKVTVQLKPQDFGYKSFRSRCNMNNYSGNFFTKNISIFTSNKTGKYQLKGLYLMKIDDFMGVVEA